MTEIDSDPAVASLLALPPREFVDACYRRILLREPDPSGTVHQLERVGAGDDRLEIAADISASDEARRIVRDHRSLAANILALHGRRVVEAARTPGSRKRAAARVGRYIAHLGGVGRPGDAPAQAHDPFAHYFNSVISDRG